MILDGFDDLNDLKKQYEITDEQLEGYEILFACYEQGGYEGSSIVILKKENKLFLNEASHCSCYGLEGQWDPIETCKEVLVKEIDSKRQYKYMDFSKFVDFIDTYQWES